MGMERERARERERERKCWEEVMGGEATVWEEVLGGPASWTEEEWTNIVISCTLLIKADADRT